MKLLVNLLPYDNGRSGISVYMRELVAALHRAGHETTLIVEEETKKDFPGYEYITVPGFCRRALFSMLFCLFVLPWLIRRPGQYDLLLIAAGNRRMTAFSRGIFTAAVVHDLSQYHVEAKYDAVRMFYIKKVLPFFVRRADLIVAISHSTEADLIRYWKIPAEKIVCVKNGLSVSDFLSSPSSETSVPACFAKPYIFYLARLEHPGKNHLNLMRAYEKLPERLRSTYNLVMAGAPWGDCRELFDYAASSCDRERMIFAGFLPKDALAGAYRNASLYVFPSLFEGFGLPLLEAMYFRVPCCCSDNGALGEIGRGAAELFDPRDPDSIAAAMERVLSDDELRRRLTDAGARRVGEFDWNDHAAKIVRSAGERGAKRRE